MPDHVVIARKPRPPAGGLQDLLAMTASQMYSKNVENNIRYLVFLATFRRRPILPYSTTLNTPEYIPIEQVNGSLPVLVGVNSMMFSPAVSGCWMCIAGMLMNAAQVY